VKYRFLPALLLLLLTISPLYSIVASERRALIISNSYDLESAKLISSELESLGIANDISKNMLNGYYYYFILGGPIAKDIGSLSRKYLPREEAENLIMVRGYWTFAMSYENSKYVMVIAGNTRRETYLATESLIKAGVIRFITNEMIEIGPPLSRAEMEDLTRLNFIWEFPPKTKNKRNLSVDIPRPLLDFFRIKPRMNVLTEFNESKNKQKLLFTWYLMVRTPHDDPYIREIVQEIDEIAEKSEISGYKKIWLLTSFVQYIKYSLSMELSPTGDYPKYPVETLFDKEGDCEDLSLLLASLFEEAGYDTLLLIMPYHAAVAVVMPPEWVVGPRVKYRIKEVEGIPTILVDSYDLYDKYVNYVIGEDNLPVLEFEFEGKHYFYVETTSAYFKPGKVPYLLQLLSVHPFPIYIVKIRGVSVPLILDYILLSRKIGDGYGISVIAKIANVGEARSGPLEVLAQIYPGSSLTVGGIDPHLVKAGNAGEKLRYYKTIEGSVPIGELNPREVRFVHFQFYTTSPKVASKISLKLGDTEIDFIRIKPFNP